MNQKPLDGICEIKLHYWVSYPKQFRGEVIKTFPIIITIKININQKKRGFPVFRCSVGMSVHCENMCANWTDALGDGHQITLCMYMEEHINGRQWLWMVLVSVTKKHSNKTHYQWIVFSDNRRMMLCTMSVLL